MNPQGAFLFLLGFVIDLYIFLVLTRFLLQLVRADFYNPVSQFVVKATNPILMPLRKIIPGYGGMDIAALQDASNDEEVDVILRVYSAVAGQADNLIRDLQDSRLADNQVGPALDEDGHWQMCLPQTRITFQLIEWILGRGDRVEVLAPDTLREHIQQHLDRTLSRYC